MGIAYAIFIQVAFAHRNRITRRMREMQAHTLASWLPANAAGEHAYVPAHVSQLMMMTGCGPKLKRSLATTVLLLRVGMALHLEEDLRAACDPAEHLMDRCAISTSPASPGDGGRWRWDLNSAAMGSTFVEMVHIPRIVWLGVIVMALQNICLARLHIKRRDDPSALFGANVIVAVIAFLLLWQMCEELHKLCNAIAGHPRAPAGPRLCRTELEFFSATGAQQRSYNPAEKYSNKGLRWALDREAHPWTDDSACNRLDPLDDDNLLLVFQIIIFMCCFNVGQACMLSNLIYVELGPLFTAACWVLPLYILGGIVPRALLVFTLCHRTASPPRELLVHALKQGNPPKHSPHAADGQYEQLSEDDLGMLTQVVEPAFAARFNVERPAGTPDDEMTAPPIPLRGGGYREITSLRHQLVGLGWVPPT
eukprot:gene18573-35072_t